MADHMSDEKRASTTLGKTVKKYIFAAPWIILVFSSTACSSQSKEFQTTIDSFVECYNVAVNTDDMLTEDIKLKVAAGDLCTLSQIYQETDNREKLNDYLDEFVTKDMFEKVYEYNKTNTRYTIEDDIVAYYKDK